MSPQPFQQFSGPRCAGAACTAGNRKCAGLPNVYNDVGGGNAAAPARPFGLAAPEMRSADFAAAKHSPSTSRTGRCRHGPYVFFLESMLMLCRVTCAFIILPNIQCGPILAPSSHLRQRHWRRVNGLVLLSKAGLIIRVGAISTGTTRGNLTYIDYGSK
jgi:hypothetical protein